MKRKKILRISAVVASVLFALSIVVGVVLTCLHSNNDTVAYAAELNDDIEYNYWIRFKDDYYTLEPSVFVISETIPYSPDFDTSTTLSFDFPFIANGEYFTRFTYRQSAEDGVTLDYQNSSYSRRVFVHGELVADTNYLNIAVGYCQMNTGLFAWFTQNSTNVNDRSFLEGFEAGFFEGIRDSGGSEEYAELLIAYRELLARYNDLYSKYQDSEQSYWNGYLDGYYTARDLSYSEGYDFGYDEGYNLGYNAGLNKAQSDSLVNPVSYFLVPVHNFLNLNLFGVFSIGTLLNILLFVAVALIFIKMFSGG